MDHSPLVETKDLVKNYVTPAQVVKVLKGVNLKIFPGEIVSIVGQSGVGKTTLLNLIGLLDLPTEGKIFLKGKEVTQLNRLEYCWVRNRQIGIVFQFYHLLPDFTALENVLLPSMVHTSLWEWQREKKKYIRRAKRLLDLVKLSHRLHHYPYQLSGGEKQRVAIARALFFDPELVLFDEPTGNLDSKTSEEIHELLWELQQRLGKTFVIVTHEEELACRADRMFRMVDGKLYEVE